MLEQERVDALHSTIVALQANGMRPSDNDEDMLGSLIIQQKQLEKQKLDILLQLAEQRLIMKAHEECTARLSAEEEELYELTNKR